MRTMTSLLMAMVMVIVAAAPAHATDAPSQPEAIIFGSVPMDTPAEMARRLTPLVKYLGKALNRPVVLKLSPDMASTIDAVAKGSVDFSYLAPVAYVRAHAAGNARLVATPVTNGKVTFKLMIVVAADSPIIKVQDLAGKTFAFGDPAALLQRAVVYGAGMPLEKLGQYKFIGHYDNIVRGVLYKDFDAGILKDTTAYMWHDKGIRIIYRSPDLPPYCIAASSKVDGVLLDKIKDALLKLDARNPEHYAVIKALDESYDGFAPTQDSEYDNVRELIAPFDAGK
jgi:phosphonate transport system substrate-binding protein